MMPLVKQTSQMGIGNRAGVIILYVVFYMPMNLLLYSGYLKNIPLALEEAARVDGAGTWKTYWSIIFPVMKPMHATVAVLTGLCILSAGSDPDSAVLSVLSETDSERCGKRSSEIEVK